MMHTRAILDVLLMHVRACTWIRFHTHLHVIMFIRARMWQYWQLTSMF